MKLKYRIERLFMRFASISRQVDGLWVGSLGDKKDEVLLQRVEDALKLIQQYDPPRYRRLLRDLQRIWVCPLIGTRGEYHVELERCSLDHKFVETSTPAQIASTIVHEATHAHPCLRKLGYPEALRYRMEQICMRQQLAFADKLPAETQIKEQVQRMLEVDPSFWSNEAFEERYPHHAFASLRESGIPDWVTNVIFKVGKFIYRLRQFWR